MTREISAEETGVHSTVCYRTETGKRLKWREWSIDGPML